MKKLQKLAKFWLPVAFWLVLIFVFSCRPAPFISKIDWGDFVFKKTLHLLEFGILFLLFYRALKNTSSMRIAEVGILSFLLTVLYASIDELHQTFVPGRTGTLRDILIDSSGAVFSWFLLWRYLPKAPSKLQDWAKKLQII